MGFSYMLIAICLHTILQCYASSEPACSKFDYEEKLLAKTIRLENTVDDLAKTVTNVQAELTEYQTNRKEIGLELEILRNDLEKQNTSIQTTMMELEAQVSELAMKVNETGTKSEWEAQCPSTYKYDAEVNL